MASLQHVYRRGHVFWWRRVHSSFHDRRVEVRLSLSTRDRLQARNRGAGLTALHDRVVAMLNERLRERRDLTERELRAIARAMYEERLAEVCADQRASPAYAELHSVANNGLVDYFSRLTRLGGHASLLPDEVGHLRAAGWDEQRIDDLRTIIEMREKDGVSQIRDDEIDRHLKALGLTPDDLMRWRVHQALFPVYRDVHADAQEQLRAMGDVRSPMVPDTPPPAEPAAVPEPASALPGPWRTVTPTQVAELMITNTPRLFEHRRGGKREQSAVGEQTLRQIRWAATLLEKSLPPGTPLAAVTKRDITALDRWFDRLPVHFGKSVHDRDPSMTLETAIAKAQDAVATGDTVAEDIGLTIATANKHFNKIGQIFRYMWDETEAPHSIDFSKFTAPIPENEREARMRLSREQGEAIFRLPPWTGCRDVKDRLHAGSTIIHDGLFYV